MKIAIINPNSTSAMTQKARVAAEQFAFEKTEILASNPTSSPVSIEGHYDEVMSLAPLMQEVQKAKAWGAEGYVIACFDDPGLAACRELVEGPVIGICEAAMHFATILADSFSVITTLPRSIPIIEKLAVIYGTQNFCRKVRAADIPVLDLEHNMEAAKEKIKKEIQIAITQDNCEAIILGCAGMADLTTVLSKECKIPVIDGVVCAIKMCEAIIGAGLKTSKISSYSYPRKK
jgi:allantoin racemase